MYIQRTIEIRLKDETTSEYYWEPTNFQNISDFTGIILLGEPGAGKSYFLKHLADQENGIFLTASKAIKKRFPKNDTTSRLLIDGFDECRSAKSEISGTISDLADALYDKLPQPFLISCREADWEDFIDTSLLKRELDLDENIPLIRLSPFTDDDISNFMSSVGITNHIKAREDASSLEIEELLRNPQTLKMLCSSYISMRRWPESKKETYQLSCIQLAEETGHFRREIYPPEIILKYAGALCAYTLLCGKNSIVTGGKFKTSETLYVKDVDPSLDWEPILDSRIFTGLDGNSYVPVHRTVAEYLAALFLAENFNEKLLATRIIAIMTNNYGIPTPLRGVAGWLCSLSTTYAQLIFDVDPLAIVHSGDLAALNDQSKYLYLQLLWKNSQKGIGIPFESLNWRKDDCFKTLWSPQNGELAKQILKANNAHYWVQRIAVHTIAGGGSSAANLRDDLIEFIGDKDKNESARVQAIECIAKIDHNYPDILYSILEDINNEIISDSDCELRGQIFELIYPSKLKPCDIGKFIIPQNDRLIGIYELFLRRKLVDLTPNEALPDLLSSITENDVSFGNRNYSHNNETYWEILLETLEANPNNVTATDIWNWLNSKPIKQSIERYHRFDTQKQKLKKWSSNNKEISSQLWFYFFENLPSVDWKIESLFWSKCFALTDETIIRIFSELQTLVSASDHNPKLEKFLNILSSFIFSKRLTESRAVIMDKISTLHPSFSDIIEMNRFSNLPDIQAKNEKLSEWELKDQKDLISFRTQIHDNMTAITQGKALWLLSKIAVGYHTGYTNLKADLPEERLVEMCGASYVAKIKKALIDQLERHDLPDLDIVHNLALNNRMRFEANIVLAALRILDRDENLHEFNFSESSIQFISYTWAAYGYEEDHKIFNVLVQRYPNIIKTSLTNYWKKQLIDMPDQIRNIGRLYYEEALDVIAPEIAESLLNECQDIPWTNENDLIKTLLKNDRLLFLETYTRRQISKTVGPFSSPKTLSYLFILQFLNPQDWTQLFKAYFAEDFTFATLIKWLDSDNDYLPEFKIPQLHIYLQILLVKAAIVTPTGTYSPTPRITANHLVSNFLKHLSLISDAKAYETLLSLHNNDTYKPWKETIGYYLRNQISLMLDEISIFPSPKELSSLLTDGSPVTHSDFMAIIEAEIIELGKEIQGGKNNTQELFWTPENDPRRKRQKKKPTNKLAPLDEEPARDRLATLLEQRLRKYGIIREPHNRNDKRTDILFTYNQMEIPLEAKRQCNKGGDKSHGVWDGIEKQLIPFYTIAPQAKGYGIFLIFWFGTDTTIAPPPKNLDIDLPSNPDELKNGLLLTIPEGYDNSIRVIVLDCSR